MRLAALVPHFAGLHLLQLIALDGCLTLTLAANRRTASCPVCHRRSVRTHSRYERRLVDLPWVGRAVHLRLQVRGFHCRNRDCPQRIFAERFPTLAAVKARRTHAQRAALADHGFEVGGAAGARLANRQGLPGSRRTILRAVQATPIPTFPTSRVLGVDDWARRKAQTYGTILVDLERHRAQLLQSDPEIEQAYVLSVEFEELVRGRAPDKLSSWLGRASGSELPEFAEFALSLERNRGAVDAALAYEWSSGQVEGQITKLKLRKCESFGRARFWLLKRRVLQAGSGRAANVFRGRSGMQHPD